LQPPKSGIDNLAAAIGLDSGDGVGWETLAAAADEATLAPIPDKKGVMCGPAGPVFDQKAAEQTAKATGTQPEEWGLPSALSTTTGSASSRTRPAGRSPATSRIREPRKQSKRPKKLSAHQHSEAIDRINTGEAVAEAARTFGVDRATAYRLKA
jgi:hypothetical protein